MEKIHETQNWFSEKTNRIDEPLARQIKGKQEKTQIKPELKEKSLQPILQPQKQKRKSCTCDNVDEPGGHYAEQNKPAAERQMGLPRWHQW